MSKIAKFFRDYRSEFKKVVWPTWAQVCKNTLVVIVCVVVIGLVIGLLDYLFSIGLTGLSKIV